MQPINIGSCCLPWKDCFLQGQYKNDLKGLLFDTQSGFGKIPGEYILEMIFQIDVNRSKWVDLGILLGMIVVYRIAFFLMIKVNEEVTPWIRGYIARRRMQRKNGNLNPTIAPDGPPRSPSLRSYARNHLGRNGRWAGCSIETWLIQISVEEFFRVTSMVISTCGHFLGFSVPGLTCQMRFEHVILRRGWSRWSLDWPVL